MAWKLEFAELTSQQEIFPDPDGHFYSPEVAYAPETQKLFKTQAGDIEPKGRFRQEPVAAYDVKM